MLHFRGGRAGISKEAYPELEPAFYDDVAKAYGDELRSLYEAGCRYVQMDDTNLAYLCDEKMREAARQRGDDPNELPHRYAKFINKVVAQKPQGMLLPPRRLAPPPLQTLVADAAHGIKAPPNAHFGTIRERPAIAFGVIRDHVVAVHTLEQKPAARLEQPIRFTQRLQIFGIIQE